MKSKNNNLNISIIILNLILFFYLIYNFNHMEIFKEKIDYVISNEGLIYVKILMLVFTILIISIFYYICSYISKKLNMSKINISILIIFISLFMIDYKLDSNLKISDKKKDLKDAIKDCNSFDIILFRSYHSYDIPELFFFRYLHSLISDRYSGHIGIIYKEKGKVYVIESTETFFNSHFDGKYKNGVILNEFEEYIKGYDGNVYICHNNIHKYYDQNKLLEISKKYKDLLFGENGFGCVHYINKIFSELDIIKDNCKTKRKLPYTFINKDIYKFNYENLGIYKIK